MPVFLAPVRVDTPAPDSPSGDAVRTACVGTTIHVVWADDRSGSTAIRYNRSTDGGQTWLASDVSLGDTGGFEGALEIACDGLNVYVAWDTDDVRLNASADGGNSWLASPVRVDHRPPAASEGDSYIGLCAEGANVRVAWTDSRNGNEDVFANRSTDGGATWLVSDVRLDTDAAGSNDSNEVRLCCAGAVVNAIWSDSRGGYGGIYSSRSTDGGATWLPVDVKLDASDDDATHATFEPRIRCDGSNVYAAWSEGAQELPSPIGDDIHACSSSTGGASWGADLTISAVPTDFDDFDPEIACEGGTAHIVFNRFADGGSGGNVMHVSTSNGGGSWSLEKVVNATALTSVGGDLGICTIGGVVVVAWGDSRNTPFEMFFNYSVDGGSSFSAADQPLGSIGIGEYPAVLCSDDGVAYAAWIDEDNSVRVAATAP